MIRRLRQAVKRAISMRSFEEHVLDMIESGECRTALDIGCGCSSLLSQFRPRIRTMGLDASREALAEARARGQHDEYLEADILKIDPESLLKPFGGERFDLVTLMDIVEHLPKRRGFELLEACDRLTRKYVVVQTPNGFLEQGPEYGNEFQRHLSGWFIHDFEGMAYTVYGSMGTKLLRGYAARPRYNFPGALKCDTLLAWLLRAEKNPRHAFSLMAIKDVRGVPARLG